MSTEQLTLQDLAQAVGVPERTIRYYIAEGLLPAPTGRGKAAFYTQEHLLRLRLVRKLVERRVPLAEQRVHELPLAEVRDLLEQEEQLDARRQRGQTGLSPKDYIAALLTEARAGRGVQQVMANAAPATASGKAGEPWLRWELAPGLELHVRTQDEAQHRKLIDRLLRAAANQTRTAGRPATTGGEQDGHQ